MKKYLFLGVLAGALLLVFPQARVSASTWAPRPSAGTTTWSSIASSLDGTRLVAVDDDYSGYGGALLGHVYTSSDSGVTWTMQPGAGAHPWTSVASSADGARLIASAGGNAGPGSIFTSADYGVTWTERTAAGSREWQAVASSADGMRLVAGDEGYLGGYLYTSSDGGATWTVHTSAGSAYWYSIASSASGAYLAAVAWNGYVYTSSDYGVNWTQQTSLGVHGWYSIASSTDGSHLVTGYFDVGTFAGGYIYTSSDYGATWIQRTAAGNRPWLAVASSSNGMKLEAVHGGCTALPTSYIYISMDGGVTWSPETSAGSRCWSHLASSGDGSNLAATDFGLYIHTTSDSSPSPALPTVVTLPATVVTTTSSFLNGGVTDVGSSIVTSYGFEYGLTLGYGSTLPFTASMTAPATFGDYIGVSPLPALACGTKYHYRAYATNSVGTGYGLDETFTTQPCSSTVIVTTLTPTGLTATDATLNGSVVLPSPMPVAAGFEYGTSMSYGTTVGASVWGGGGSFNTSVAGLACGTIYHYRATATTPLGMFYGADVMFATLPCPGPLPVIFPNTISFNSVTSTSVTLNGTVTSSLPGSIPDTLAGFQYAVGSGPLPWPITPANTSMLSTPFSSPAPYSVTLTGLMPGTTYSFRSVIMTPSYGPGYAYGAGMTFTTLP